MTKICADPECGHVEHNHFQGNGSCSEQDCPCRKFKEKVDSPPIKRVATAKNSKVEDTEFNLSEKIFYEEADWGTSHDSLIYVKDIKTFIKKIADKCFVIDGFSVANARVVVDIEDVKILAGEELCK